MSLDPLTAAFEIGKSVIERVWPNPVDQAKGLLKLEELRQKGDLALLNAEVVALQGQMQINAVEASHKSIFVAGWRPFIGWVGGISLAYIGVLEPLMRFVAKMAGYEGDFPEIDVSATVPILMGMLGVGTMRSLDKKNGTQTDKFK